MKLFRLLALFAFVVLALSSCHKEDEPGTNRQQPSRVVMVYMVSENSLLGYDAADIQEMLRSAKDIPDNSKLIIYLDDNHNPAIYVIDNKTKGELLSKLTPEYVYPEELNSCKASTLSGFIKYVQEHHKADSYAMVLWSHSSGWIPPIGEHFARRRAFGVDNDKSINSNQGKMMSISELHKGLQAFDGVLDYIMFDACFMQCIEVAYELKDVTRFLISSPAEIPVDGAIYDELLPSLFNMKNYVEMIAYTYCDSYKIIDNYDAVISSVDCSKLEGLSQKTSYYLQKYKDDFLHTNYSGVLNYFIYDSWKMNGIYPDMLDMKAVFMTVLNKDEYKDWEKAFNLAVPYRFANSRWYSVYANNGNGGYVSIDQDTFGGISMYLPFDKYMEDSESINNKWFIDGYWECQWAKDIWK